MLLKFWFAPVVTAVVFVLSYLVGFGCFSGHVADFTADGGVVDCLSFAGYAALLFTFWRCRKSFETPFEKRSLAMFVFFAVAAALREAGIQHWLASRDTTAFKIRFLTNPDNPLGEKIIAFALLAAMAGLFAYAMFLWLIPAFKGLFKKYAGSTTVITLLSVGALCKIADRTHGNLAKHGIILPRDGFAFQALEIAEESLEMMLPYLGIVAVLQFCADKKLFYPRGK